MNAGLNPNQVIQQLTQQNPQAQILFNQMQQSGMSPKDFTMQFARQNNIDINSIVRALNMSGIKF
jgi:hypothetical protein